MCRQYVGLVFSLFIQFGSSFMKFSLKFLKSYKIVNVVICRNFVGLKILNKLELRVFLWKDGQILSKLYIWNFLCRFYVELIIIITLYSD